MEELNVDELEDMIAADERRYQLENFVEHWRSAASRSPEIRHLESEVIRLTREGSKLLDEMGQFEKGSPNHQYLFDEGIQNGRDMANTLRKIEEALANHPAFTEGHLNLFRGRNSFGMKTGSTTVDLSVKAGRYQVQFPWFEERR